MGKSKVSICGAVKSRAFRIQFSSGAGVGVRGGRPWYFRYLLGFSPGARVHSTVDVHPDSQVPACTTLLGTVFIRDDHVFDFDGRMDVAAC